MKKTEILDCTLRDGGYYTNWDFDDHLVRKYIQAMQEIPVDYLEIGYRSTHQKEYAGKYFYLPGFVIEQIAELNTSRKLAVMMNVKSTSLKDISRLVKGLHGKIQLIRLAVNPDEIDQAGALSEVIKSEGFEVAINLMYMSRYVRNSSYLSLLNSLDRNVDYINFVDSYGGMYPNLVSEMIIKAKESCNVKIGFHGHNNLELAFANTIAAIDAGCDVVDCTLMGMGRGAGNLKTELLLTSLVSEQKAEFDFNVLSTLIELWIPLLHQYQWGTNLPYMVSGASSLPQKEVMEWVTQRYYSFNSIIRALHNRRNGENDNMKLPDFIPDRTYAKVIIIGGGDSARIHADAVIRFARANENICLVHASSKNAKYYENLNVDQFFCLVGHEGKRLEEVFSDLQNFKGKCILPPYPRKMGTYIPQSIMNQAYELRRVDFTEMFQDSHTALALQSAKELHAQKVFLAGYDGYSQNTITLKEQGLITENEYLFSKYVELNKVVASLFITKYSVPTVSVYTLID